MSDTVNPNAYTAVQLRNWLHNLGLTTSGTKNALVLRLNDVPICERGECPLYENSGTSIENEADDIGTDGNDSNDLVLFPLIVNEENAIGGEKNDCGQNVQMSGNGTKKKQMSVTEQTSDAMKRNKNVQMSENGPNNKQMSVKGQTSDVVKRNNNEVANYELLKRELDILKREKEILEKENRLYKMKEELERKYGNMALCYGNRNNNENSVEKNNNEQINNERYNNSANNDEQINTNERNNNEQINTNERNNNEQINDNEENNNSAYRSNNNGGEQQNNNGGEQHNNTGQNNNNSGEQFINNNTGQNNDNSGEQYNNNNADENSNNRCERNNNAGQNKNNSGEYFNNNNGGQNNNNNNNGKDNNNSVQNDNAYKVSFVLLKELLPEYDGANSPEVFVAQLKNVAALYSVDDSTLKALLMAKVKGKVQAWLHSKSNFVHENINVLFVEIIELFGNKENKLSTRRKFESRKWQYGEDFVCYYNEKTMLATRLEIAQDELIDYLIEGIPDENLKIHANLQCFKQKAQLLSAFSKISLKRREFANKNERQNPEIRCYNCNSKGHMANQCQKSPREVGACYGCGSMDHRVAACPERKTDGPKNA